MRASELDITTDDDLGARSRSPGALQWAGLLLGAARRRWWLAVPVFIAAMAAVGMFYRVKRPLYRVEARILTTRQQALPSSVRPTVEDSPTRSAWDVIHRRENLIALAQAAGLVDSSIARTPETGWASVFRAGPGERDEEEPMDRAVLLLDRALTVTTEEGTLTISLDWPDPKQAYQVVNGALQNFIEARHVQEVTAIDEVLSVLRGKAVAAHERFVQVVEQVQREPIGAERSRESPTLALARAGAPRAPSEELARLRSLLEAKQHAIEDVEEFRRRRLADLQAQLESTRGVLSEAHPTVIGLRQDIDALSRESPQVGTLRDEERQIRKDIQALGAAEPVATTTRPGSAVAPPLPARTRAPTTVDDDERVVDVRLQYQQIMERVNSAQLELDAVRAAFKYRYNVVWPPQMPRDPVSPDPKKFFGVGLLLSLGLAVVVSALPDLWSRRVVERWQIERSLDLPILGDVRRK